MFAEPMPYLPHTDAGQCGICGSRGVPVSPFYWVWVAQDGARASILDGGADMEVCAGCVARVLVPRGVARVSVTDQGLGWVDVDALIVDTGDAYAESARWDAQPMTCESGVWDAPGGLLVMP